MRSDLSSLSCERYDMRPIQLRHDAWTYPPSSIFFPARLAPGTPLRITKLPILPTSCTSMPSILGQYPSLSQVLLVLLFCAWQNDDFLKERHVACVMAPAAVHWSHKIQRGPNWYNGVLWISYLPRSLLSLWSKVMKWAEKIETSECLPSFDWKTTSDGVDFHKCLIGSLTVASLKNSWNHLIELLAYLFWCLAVECHLRRRALSWNFIWPALVKMLLEEPEVTSYWPFLCHLLTTGAFGVTSY